MVKFTHSPIHVLMYKSGFMTQVWKGEEGGLNCRGVGSIISMYVLTCLHHLLDKKGHTHPLSMTSCGVMWCHVVSCESLNKLHCVCVCVGHMVKIPEVITNSFFVPRTLSTFTEGCPSFCSPVIETLKKLLFWNIQDQ